MVKFLLPLQACIMLARNSYRRANHGSARASVPACCPAECDCLKFEENSHRIRLDFTQKAPGRANGGFKPICYGLVQRRRKGRWGIAGRIMFFLLRMTFWLGVVCVLLSTGSRQPTSPDAQINTTEAVTLASAAVSDARGFCGRQPEACTAGGKVAVAIGHKAEAGARMIYEFITAKLANFEPAAKPAAKTPPLTAGTSTLSESDVQPAWHGPVPLPPRRAARPSA